MTTNAIPVNSNQNERPVHLGSSAHHREFRGWIASRLSMPFLMITADFLLLFSGTMLGGTVGHLLQRSHTFALSPRQLLLGSFTYSCIVLCLLQAENAYPRVCSLLHVKDTEIILKGSIKAILISLVLCIVARYPIPRMAMLCGWVMGTLLLTVGDVWTREAIRKHFAPTFPNRRSLIIGTKRTARRFFTGALHSPILGIDPVGFVPSSREDHDTIFSNDYFQRDSRPIFHEPLSPELLRRLEIQEIYVCDPNISDRLLSHVKEIAQDANCTLSLVDGREVLAGRAPTWVWEMDGLFVATTGPSQSEWLYRVSKRFLDIACASILILLSAPMWALVATLIKLESEGPIIFRQTRVGQNGKLFEILKFRSMKADAPKYARSPVECTDFRITRVGRFLRQTSFDEVPQLINVLKGEMSLVGPRPEMPFITEDYGPWEATRLTVPQGITGFWQLSADRRYAIHQSIEYDLYYIQNRTLLMDVAILLHTLVYAAKGI